MKRIVPAAAVALMLSIGAQMLVHPQDQATERRAEAKQALNVHALTAAAATAQCFTSGSPTGSDSDPFGRTFLKICISDRGLVTSFESPSGQVHLFGREGYAVCSGVNADTVHGFDAGMAEGGWNAPTISQPNGAGKLPLIITRDSSDGKVRLTQTFTINSSARELQIVAVVKNLSASPWSPLIVRYFDGDVDGTSQDDRYDQSRDSVWAVPHITSQVANGLMLTQSSASITGSVSSVEKFGDWNPTGLSFQSARKCNGRNFQAVPTVAGDFVGRLLASVGTIPAGQTKTVTYRYRRF